MPLSLNEAREIISVATRRYSDLVVERDQLLRKSSTTAPSDWSGIADLHDAVEVMQQIHEATEKVILEIHLAKERQALKWPEPERSEEVAELLATNLRSLARQIETKYSAIEFSSRTYRDKVQAASKIKG